VPSADPQPVASPRRADARAATLGSRALRTLGGLLVAAAITVGLIALAEWGAGVYLRRHVQALTEAWLRHPDEVDSVIFLMDLNVVPLVLDGNLLWRNAPGARRTQPVNPQPLGHDDRWSLAIDDRGFRGTDTPRDGPHPGVYRVLCVGDSITFGFNVDQAEVYPAQLAAQLTARHPGRRFEVVNAGVPGWTWAQGRRFLELEGRALAPDAIVIAHGTNDQYFGVKSTDNERLGGTGIRDRLRRRLDAALLRSNVYWALTLLAPARTPVSSPGCVAQERDTGSSCRRVAVGEIRQAVADVHRLAADMGVPLVVLNLDFMQTHAVEGVRAGAKAEQVPFIDFVERFDAARTAADVERAAARRLAPGRAPDAAATGPRTVVLRVVGRRAGAAYGVRGSDWLHADLAFEAPLVDDGTHGDEVAGDGVFSGTVMLPPGVDVIQYRFTEDGAAEFTPLPPLFSQNGYRLLHAERAAVGPVEAFGDLGFMTERTHPNGAGDALIATGVVEALEALPSFDRVRP
jgi:lysophospholipase L1-like esterase